MTIRRCGSIRCMRTTLRLDDDVLMAVKERARRDNRTAGEVLSELARQALTSTSPKRSGDATDNFLGFEPLPHRGAPVTNALIGQLRDESPEG